jgi:ATP synthase protein I
MMGNTQTFHKARLAVLTLTAWQLLLTAAFAGAVWLGGSAAAALSIGMGGCIGMLAGLYQAIRLLQVDAGAQPQAFLQGLWISELVKIVLTGALFLVAIRLLEARMVPTIAGFAATYIVYWVALGTRYPWFEPDVATQNLRERNWPDT